MRIIKSDFYDKETLVQVWLWSVASFTGAPRVCDFLWETH